MKKVLVIDVTMKTVSPLYTGEVREEEKRAANANFPVRKTATGRAIIPFKGALRSTLEKMLHAKGEDVCNTGKSKARPCGRCTTCDLFGSMGRKGRVSTDFLMSEADRREIIRQATHTRIDRDKGGVSDSFTGEEVVEGAVFHSRITIDGYREGDEALIESALKAIKEAGIGGWTNKGYGRVTFESAKKEVEADRFLKD